MGAFYRELLRRRPVESWGNFSWLSLRTLLQSANDVVVKRLDTSIVNQRRMRWTAEQRARGVDVDVPIRAPDIQRMVLLGDPGEMDASQYVLVESVARTDADALLLMSDVVYPAGNVNAWRDAVYLPYLGEPRELWDAAAAAAGVDLGPPRRRVFATPGNHDWYDGLTGFMFHACGAEPLGGDAFSAEGLTTRRKLAQLLWRNPARPQRAALEPLRRRAAALCPPGDGPEAIPRQPGPYFLLDIGTRAGGGPALRLVCVDTGIDGSIDAEQALWLEDAVAGDLPKILVLGKPLVTDDEVWPVPVDRGPEAPPRTVTDVLREHGERVVASVAGDIHNAQRLVLAGDPRDTPDGLVLEADVPARESAAAWGLPPVHVVAGGGGAFLSGTHRLALDAEDGVRLPGVGTVPAARHVRFPTREASVLLFARRIGRAAGAVVVALGLAQAAALVTLAAVTDRAAPDAALAGATSQTWRVVAGAFAAVALAGVLPGAVAALRRRPPPLTPLALLLVALAGFLITWEVDAGEALVLLAGAAAVVGLPVLLVLAPVLRAYPELRRRVPLRVLAGLALSAFAAGQGAAELDSRLVALVAAGVVAVVLGAAALIAAATRRLDAAAVDGRLRAARVVAHAGAFWPVAAVGFAVALVPGWLGAQEGTRDAVVVIALVEGVLLSLGAGLLGLRAAWSARTAFPRRALGVLAAAGAVGAAAAVVSPLDAGWGWEAALALPAATVGAGLLLLTRRRTHAGQVTLALRARDGHDAPGLQRSVALFRAMAVAAMPAISEMADATGPPFHKSFLVLDVRRPGEIVLELRACDDEGDASLVDRVTLRVGTAARSG